MNKACDELYKECKACSCHFSVGSLESQLAQAREEIGRLLKIQSVGEYQKNLDEIEALRLSLHQMDEINTNLKAKFSKLQEVNGAIVRLWEVDRIFFQAKIAKLERVRMALEKIIPLATHESNCICDSWTNVGCPGTVIHRIAEAALKEENPNG